MQDTFTFKASFFFSVLAALAFAVGILAGYAVWGSGVFVTAQAGSQESTNPGGATTTGEYTRYDIPTEGHISLGPKEAPIVIVEFSDFQCPYCRRFHQETFQSLMDAYPGKIRFVYRNLPLTQIHPEAFPAAVASRCANDQDAFWKYHNRLFSSEQLSEQTYIQYAADLDLDTEIFKACLDSGTHDDFIQSDMDFAINLGVQSTPTFFINGLAIVGAQPITAFKQLIDKELAGEFPG
jgi:protein-disulfide isomerase